MTFHARNSWLVSEFLRDLEAYVEAIRNDDFAKAVAIAKRDLFADGAALFGEGFGVFYAEALQEMRCKDGSLEECPLSVSAFFQAMASFGRHDKPEDLKSSDL